MLHKLFTVFDEKAQVFLPPFFVPTVGIAIRAFKDCINGDHQFGKHPEDYTLFQLGSFDDSNAQMDASAPQTLGNGVQFINPEHTDSLGEFRNGKDNPPIQPDQNG